MTGFAGDIKREGNEQKEREEREKKEGRKFCRERNKREGRGGGGGYIKWGKDNGLMDTVKSANTNPTAKLQYLLSTMTAIRNKLQYCKNWGRGVGGLTYLPN